MSAHSEDHRDRKPSKVGVSDAIGSAPGDIALGYGFGVALGAALGAAFSRWRRRAAV